MNIVRYTAQSYTVTFIAILITMALSSLASGQRGFQTYFDLTNLTYSYPSIGTPGDIQLMSDGRLLMTFDKNWGIYGRYSDDLGETWGSEITFVPSPGFQSPYLYVHSSLVQANNGDLLMAFQKYWLGSRPVYKEVHYKRLPNVNNATWGNMTYMALDGLFNDKLLLTSTGRLIAPVEKEVEIGDSDHRGYASYTWYSDDNGFTWNQSSNQVNMLPIEVQEPHVVELKDSRLMMLARTYSGYIVRSYSNDAGITWGAGQAVPGLVISEDSSAISVTRIPSTGDLLLLRTTGGTPPQRTPFVSVISTDDGATWINERVIAGNPTETYGYPGVQYIDDKVFIGFMSTQGGQLARIGIDWLYIVNEQVGAIDPATNNWTFNDFNGGTGTQYGGTDSEDYWRIQRDAGAAGRYLFSLNSAQLTDPSGWTMTARIKANQTTYADDVSFSVWDQTHRWSMHLLPNGIFSMNQNWGAGAQLSDIDPTAAYHTYQMIYNPTNEVVTYYVDGTSVGASGRDDVPAYSNINRAEFGDGNGLLASDSQWAGVRFQIGQHPIPQAYCSHYPASDANRDCRVDMQDMFILTSEWLECNLVPAEACWD